MALRPKSPFVEADAKSRAAYTKAIKAGLAGFQKSPLYFDDPRKPYCDEPVQIASYADPRQDFLPSVEVLQWVPCRKCKKCLQFRQMRWRERAFAEFTEAPRTWVVTLTFSPVHLAGLFMLLNPNKGSLNRQIDDVCYREVQKYIKRLRKAGHEFRYFAVFEGQYESTTAEGDSAKLHRAHYHLMLHEKNRPISWRQITDAWRRGSFSHAKLAGSIAAASYVTKYLTKSAGRIRASSDYGQPQAATQRRKAKAAEARKRSAARGDKGEVTAPLPAQTREQSDRNKCNAVGGNEG